jgi:hypothetical protein
MDKKITGSLIMLALVCTSTLGFATNSCNTSSAYSCDTATTHDKANSPHAVAVRETNTASCTGGGYYTQHTGWTQTSDAACGTAPENMVNTIKTWVSPLLSAITGVFVQEAQASHSTGGEYAGIVDGNNRSSGGSGASGRVVAALALLDQCLTHAVNPTGNQNCKQECSNAASTMPCTSHGSSPFGDCEQRCDIAFP